MSYSVNPFGGMWHGGVFCVPNSIAEKQMKFCSELQLKTLLLLLSGGGNAEISALSKALSASESDITECLEYWMDEGIVINSAETAPPAPTADGAEEPPKKVLETLPMPSLTPKDIVVICDERREIADLLRGAERILASSLSNSMKSNIVNMVTYYGLPVPVVLTLLEYYKAERDSGKNITTRTLQSMAKEWANEDISTLDAASAKLQETAGCDELWNEVISLCEFDYRKPTSVQRKMMARWRNDFDKEMIFFACNTMKKYTDKDKRSLKAVDNILKEWKRKGFKTPDEVKFAPKEDKNSKKGRLKSKPSFDIDELAKKALLNDDFDI